MRRRSVLAAAGAGAAALLVGGTRAEAATLSSTASAKAAAVSGGDVPWASASLRNLADRVGLRIGSALYPQDIETASWAAIAGSQFSVVTLKAALAVPECISFTVWGWTDANSWVPGSFSGEGYADIYDVNQQPKAAYYALQSELGLASNGAPYRVKSYTPRS